MKRISFLVPNEVLELETWRRYAPQTVSVRCAAPSAQHPANTVGNL